MESRGEVTELLVDWNNGRQNALDELVPVVQTELHRLAQAYMRRERDNHTLQPTALVNEAYLRLVDQSRVRWQNRAHFYGVAAQLMRRILVDHARKRHAAKRGGRDEVFSFDESYGVGVEQNVDLMALEEALCELEEMDPRLGRVVELKFFADLTIEEIAEVLQISPATVKREWTTAKAWLGRQMGKRAE